MSTFFLPGVDPGQAEDLYLEVAAELGVPPLPVGQRIASISFDHNGESWTATVGEQLSGQREVPARRTRSRQGFLPQLPRVTPLSDPATVQVIYEGQDCFHVVTDRYWAPKNRASQWESPFVMGHHAVHRVAKFNA